MARFLTSAVAALYTVGMNKVSQELKVALVAFFAEMEDDFKRNPYYIAIAETAEGYMTGLDRLIEEARKEAQRASGRVDPQPTVCPHCAHKTPTNEHTWPPINRVEAARRHREVKPFVMMIPHDCSALRHYVCEGDAQFGLLLNRLKNLATARKEPPLDTLICGADLFAQLSADTIFQQQTVPMIDLKLDESLPPDDGVYFCADESVDNAQALAGMRHVRMMDNPSYPELRISKTII